MRKTIASLFSFVSRVMVVSLVLAVALSSTAFSSEIKVMCTNAFKGTMAKLAPQYERQTGDKLLITYDLTGRLQTRINKGEAVDVIVLISQPLAELVKSGKVAESGRADIARSGIGVAIRRGAPRPDITTLDAFKKTLLAAKSITYTDPAAGGASSVYFSGLIKKLGMAEQLQPKTKFAPGGTSSGTLVAAGEAEFAVQMISELIDVPGVEILGPLPPEVQSFTVISAGVGRGVADPAAAARLVRFLSSPAVAPVLREAGLEPPK